MFKDLYEKIYLEMYKLWVLKQASNEDFSILYFKRFSDELNIYCIDKSLVDFNTFSASLFEKKYYKDTFSLLYNKLVLFEFFDYIYEKMKIKDRYKEYDKNVLTGALLFLVKGLINENIEKLKSKGVIFNGSVSPEQIFENIISYDKYSVTLFNKFSEKCIHTYMLNMDNCFSSDYILLLRFIREVGYDIGKEHLEKLFDNYDLFFDIKAKDSESKYAVLINYCKELYLKDNNIKHGLFVKVYPDGCNNGSSFESYEESFNSFVSPIKSILYAISYSITGFYYEDLINNNQSIYLDLFYEDSKKFLVYLDKKSNKQMQKSIKDMELKFKNIKDDKERNTCLKWLKTGVRKTK